MKYLILILLFANFNAFAEGLKVYLNPSSPVYGESFSLMVEIDSFIEEEPRISFDAGDIDVIGKNQVSTQIQHQIINGKISKSRKITYSYDMVAPRVGIFRIKNITVGFSTKELKHDDIKFKVVRNAVKKADFFLQAEVSKEQVYVGEKLKLKYFFYRKRNHIDIENIEFPKVKNAISRKVDVLQKHAERVTVGNELYIKELVWNMELFPTKKGKFRVPAMRIRVHYQKPSPYGSFFGRPAKKDLRSSTLEIDVLSLPLENVPPSFTGLVGKHTFSLSVPRTKFITNEALEAKLEVSGEGALEDFIAPKIFNDTSLEEFEQQSDFVIGKNAPSTKIIDYTYLTRSPKTIKESKFEMSYFDPETKSYVIQNINVPKIEIIGGNVNPVPSQAGKNENKPSPEKILIGKTFKDEGSRVVSPTFLYDESFSNKYSFVNIILGIINFILLTLIIFRYIKNRKTENLAKEIIKKIKSNGMNYSNLFVLLEFYRKTAGLPVSLSPAEVISKSNLSNSAKNYFRDIFNKTEAMQYKKEKYNKKPQYEGRFFKELLKSMKK